MQEKKTRKIINLIKKIIKFMNKKVKAHKKIIKKEKDQLLVLHTKKSRNKMILKIKARCLNNLKKIFKTMAI
jgi:hypothetical protein